MSVDPRVAKIQSLIDHGATEGERSAARAAMKRLKESGVDTEATDQHTRTGSKDFYDAYVRAGGKITDMSDKDIYDFLVGTMFRYPPTSGPPPPRERDDVRVKAAEMRVEAVRLRINHLRREMAYAERDLYDAQSALRVVRSGTDRPPRHNGRVHYDGF